MKSFWAFAATAASSTQEGDLYLYLIIFILLFYSGFQLGGSLNNIEN